MIYAELGQIIINIQYNGYAYDKEYGIDICSDELLYDISVETFDIPEWIENAKFVYDMTVTSVVLVCRMPEF